VRRHVQRLQADTRQAPDRRLLSSHVSNTRETARSVAISSSKRNVAWLESSMASNEGSLYLTGSGVLVFDKGRRQIDRIPVPDEQWTANVSFGGKDKHMLFITATPAFTQSRVRVKSANTAK